MIFRTGKRPKMCPPCRQQKAASDGAAADQTRSAGPASLFSVSICRSDASEIASSSSPMMSRSRSNVRRAGGGFFVEGFKVNGSMIDANSLLTARCVASLRKRVRLLPKADIGCEHQDAGVEASDATQPCCFPRRTSKRNSYRSRKSLIKAGFFVFQRRPDRRAALARKGARRRAAWPIWLTRSRTGLAAASPFNPKICPAGRTQNELGLRPRSQAGKMRLAQ